MHCPGVEIVINASATGRILPAMKNHTLDAGYLFGPIADQNITAHRLGQADLVVIAPSSWADPPVLDDWEAFAQRPWIVSDEHCPFQDLIDAWFSRQGVGLSTHWCHRG